MARPEDRRPSASGSTTPPSPPHKSRQSTSPAIAAITLVQSVTSLPLRLSATHDENPQEPMRKADPPYARLLAQAIALVFGRYASEREEQDLSATPMAF